MLFCHGEGPRTILALFVGFHVYNQEISHITYICQISSLYPMCATIECVIQVVSWLDCINYTPQLILILIKRTFSKYPALIWYSICQFRLRALMLKRV
jgi:hypothetical protein